jgi:hypothetical protein
MELIRMELIVYQGVSRWVNHSSFKNAFTLQLLPHLIFNPSKQLDILKKDLSISTTENFYCNFAFPILAEMTIEEANIQVDYLTEEVNKQIGKTLWVITATLDMNTEVFNQIEFIHKKGHGPISTRYIHFNFGISLTDVDINLEKEITLISAFHGN